MVDMFLKDIPDNFAARAISAITEALCDLPPRVDGRDLYEIRSIFEKLAVAQKEYPQKAMHVVDFT